MYPEKKGATQAAFSPRLSNREKSEELVEEAQNSATMGVDDNSSIVSRITASTATATVSTCSTYQSDDFSWRATPSKTSQAMPPDAPHRAVHRISLSALSQNYACVESAANRQRCSVIAVVKADGYGHGAIHTALHLADSCGAEAFAVATLEEAIDLRRAFDTTPPFEYRQKADSTKSDDVSTLFSAPDSATLDAGSSSRPESPTNLRSLRPAKIRILVLGPPVGFPRCFDDYYHYDIEVMVSGPEIAQALKEWVSNPKERKRTQVARAAMEAKAHALTLPVQKETIARTKPAQARSQTNGIHTPRKPTTAPAIPEKTNNVFLHQASTLSNVSGQELAMEVRSIIMNQQALQAQKKSQPPSPANSGYATPADRPLHNNGTAEVIQPQAVVSCEKKGELFQGLEAIVKTSRNREVAVARATALETGEEKQEDEIAKDANRTTKLAVRRRLRWHALVDSGMGRLGFKTEVSEGQNMQEKKQKRDTVEILKELVHSEIHDGAPIEFFGMCTHMAEANSSSSFTHSQMSRFLDLLTRVREAGILVPTLSTDNSSALLTTTLNHFDPNVVLKQADVDTRGWVRTGGAIYGQRADFPQLRAVSTLTASVRHVAILKEGDSAGYDRAYVAPVDVRIATLTIGFADGYPRELGNGVGKVSIRGTVFPVAGNVCMDMLMVNLGPAYDEHGAGAQVVVGDTATLWGPESENDFGGGRVKLKDLAATLKTTQSALTCGLDKVRVPRELT